MNMTDLGQPLTRAERKHNIMVDGLVYGFLLFVFAGCFFFWYLFQIIMEAVADEKRADAWGVLGVSGFLMIIGLTVFIISFIAWKPSDIKRNQ